MTQLEPEFDFEKTLKALRNGKSKKTIKSLNGNFELSTPRDRSGTFSPQLIKKHQTTLSDEIEGKIIALYGLGMS